MRGQFLAPTWITCASTMRTTEYKTGETPARWMRHAAG
jgi:hypothetical protein